MIKLLSHLSYVAITTPDVEASVRFYEEQVGAKVVGRFDGRVPMRCWDDYYHYSLVIVAGEEPSSRRTRSASRLGEDCGSHTRGGPLASALKDGAHCRRRTTPGVANCFETP